MKKLDQQLSSIMTKAGLRRFIDRMPEDCVGVIVILNDFDGTYRYRLIGGPSDEQQVDMMQSFIRWKLEQTR